MICESKFGLGLFFFNNDYNYKWFFNILIMMVWHDDAITTSSFLADWPFVHSCWHWVHAPKHHSWSRVPKCIQSGAAQAEIHSPHQLLEAYPTPLLSFNHSFVCVSAGLPRYHRKAESLNAWHSIAVWSRGRNCSVNWYDRPPFLHSKAAWHGMWSFIGGLQGTWQVVSHWSVPKNASDQ